MVQGKAAVSARLQSSVRETPPSCGKQNPAVLFSTEEGLAQEADGKLIHKKDVALKTHVAKEKIPNNKFPSILVKTTIHRTNKTKAIRRTMNDRVGRVYGTLDTSCSNIKTEE